MMRLAARFHGVRSISAIWSRRNFTVRRQRLPESIVFQAFRRPAAKACWRTVKTAAGENHLSEGRAQVLQWQTFFSDPTQWWDNRKETPRHPHFRHKTSKEALLVNNWYKPAWVEPQLAMFDAEKVGRMGIPSRSVSTPVSGAGRLAAHDGELEVRGCRKLCEDGQITQAVDALNVLVQRGFHIDNNLFYCFLKRCIAEKDLVLGRRIHALSVESGYEGNAFLATHLIGLYASHGKLEEAMGVFVEVKSPSAYNWSSIIFAYTRHGEPAQAIRLYKQMRQSTVKPDNRIFVAVLKACASAGDLAAGKDVHSHICENGVKPDIYVQTSLVDMYAKCGSLQDAQRVFDGLPQKNVVTWTVMIAGYAQQGLGQEALNLYSRMQLEGLAPPDSFTFVCLLQACASVAALHEGEQLHAQIGEQGLESDVVVGASLVDMYVKCGSLDYARKVFDRLVHKNIVTWTTIIAGYSQQGMGQEALRLFSSMQQEGISPPDSVTLGCLLQACASAGVAALPQGKQIHSQIEQQGLQDDVVVSNNLVNMYAKCGSVEDAQRVFDSLSQKNVVTWTAMIAGYAQQGLCHKALSIYNRMQQEGTTPPNSVTFVCLLQACAGEGKASLHQGKQLHADIEEQGMDGDVVVAGSLVNMYCKCGSLKDARSLFDRLSQKNVVTWTAMISGYAQEGLCQEALGLYTSMLEEGITPPNSVTFVSLLQACASVAALPLGKQLHAELEKRGLQADKVVGSSLVDMYAKCGSLEDAQQVFDSLPEREIVAWSALIAGYACRGDSGVVFDLLHRMRLEGILPDGVTLLSVLTVCSHVGLVDKGRQYFEAMTTDYGITPTIEHYTCMIDLLGRAGHLDEALRMAKALPFQPPPIVWLTLLGACQKWSNVEVGRQAFEFAVMLDEKGAAAYTLMSNIYASVEMWEEAKEMQSRRVKSFACKQPGQSWWTDMDGGVHSFVVGGI